MPFIDESMLDDVQPSGAGNSPPAEPYISNREETPIAGGQFITPDMLDPEGPTNTDYAVAGASGYLDGIAGMLDFGQMLFNPGRMFLPKDPNLPGLGDLFRKSVDTISGVPDSTRIGEGTAINTAASYLPGFVLGPENILENAVQTLFTGGGAALGEAVGGKTGELVGGVAGALTPIGIQKAGAKLTSLADNVAPRTMEQQIAKTLQITPNDIKGFGGKEGFNKALNTALDKGIFAGDDLAVWSSNADDQISKIGDDVSTLLSQADATGTPAQLPKFNSSLEFIQKNRYQKKELVDQFERRLETLDQEWDGTAAGLAKLKSELYKVAYSGSTDSKLLDRAIANDLKTAVEDFATKTVGDDAGKVIASLNAEQGKYLGLQDILERADNKIAAKELKGGANYSIFSNPVLNVGGAITSAITGNPAPLAATVGLSTAKTVLNSSAGRRIASGALKGAGAATQLFGGSPAALTQPAAKAAETLQRSRKAEPRPEILEVKSSAQKLLSEEKRTQSTGRKGPGQSQSLVSPTSPKDSPINSLFSTPKAKGETPTESLFKKTSQVEKAIDSDPVDSTIYEMESSRGKKLKNPDSSAKGAFQLLDSTSKKLGVSNPMDLGENYQGYLKLKAENVKRFGDDPGMIYAGHYLGATTLNKLINDEPLTEKQRKQVEFLKEELLPKFRRIYNSKVSAA